MHSLYPASSCQWLHAQVLHPAFAGLLKITLTSALVSLPDFLVDRDIWGAQIRCVRHNTLIWLLVHSLVQWLASVVVSFIPCVFAFLGHQGSVFSMEAIASLPRHHREHNSKWRKHIWWTLQRLDSRMLYAKGDNLVAYFASAHLWLFTLKVSAWTLFMIGSWYSHTFPFWYCSFHLGCIFLAESGTQDYLSWQ